MKLRATSAVFAALAFMLTLVPVPGAAETTKAAASASSSSAKAVPASGAVLVGRPDLKVSVLPDLPSKWPLQYFVENVGHAKSDDTWARIDIFIVGEDAITKKSCIPHFSGLDKLVLGLSPGASTVIHADPADPAKKKYLPGPAAVVVGSTVKCTFQVGLSLANVGKNDSNNANDQVIRNIHIDMPLHQ